MAGAEVGDDGFGDDPTVCQLEEVYAERVGKAAAVFVPSGTMANQVALRVLSTPGTAVLAGRHAHVVAFEYGAAARNAGVQLTGLDDTDGLLDPTQVAEELALVEYHQPAVSLVTVENTHMAAGGVPWPIERLREVAQAAGDLPVHMDGARLFNAEIATGVPAATMAAIATTVMSCLSKGLCAPVGSLLAGPADVIDAARAERKRLGGGMRQVGVIAAAGLVALASMVERMADDHARARRLAEAVAERFPEAGLDPESVRTNIVVFSPPDPGGLVAHLAEHGVLGTMIAPHVVRLVTHHDIDDDGVEQAAVALAKAP
jgi:threonine aldolase